MADAQVYRINGWSRRPHEVVLMLGMVLLFMLIPIAASLLLGHDPRAVLGRMLTESPVRWVAAAYIVTLPLKWAVERRHRQFARLCLDAQGMHFRSGLPPLAAALFHPEWRMRWNEIPSSRYFPRLGVLHLGRTGRAGRSGATRIIRVTEWIPEAQADAPVHLKHLPE